MTLSDQMEEDMSNSLGSAMAGTVETRLSEEELKDQHEMKLLERGLPDGWPESFRPLTDDQIQGIDDHVTRLLQRAKRRRRQRKTTNIILETLRKMAWADAKAKLEGMLETYWSMDTEFEDVETEILGFIERMEERL